MYINSVFPVRVKCTKTYRHGIMWQLTGAIFLLVAWCKPLENLSFASTRCDLRRLCCRVNSFVAAAPNTAKERLPFCGPSGVCISCIFLCFANYNHTRLPLLSVCARVNDMEHRWIEEEMKKLEKSHTKMQCRPPPHNNKKREKGERGKGKKKREDNTTQH